MSIVEHDCAREIMLIYNMYDGLYLHETSSGAMYVSKYISTSGIISSFLDEVGSIVAVFLLKLKILVLFQSD